MSLRSPTRQLAAALCAAALAALSLAGAAAGAASEDCETEPRPECFGIERVDASLSTHQAGAHPDIATEFEVVTDPSSEPNVFGLKRGYGITRDVKVSLPPGLLANPNAVQQCTVAQLETYQSPGGGCPNASQVGRVEFIAYDLPQAFTEPLYMMVPPADGSSVARLGFIGGLYTILVQADLRSEGDYGVDATVIDSPAAAQVIRVKTTIWGVPAAAAHDRERCTPAQAFAGLTICEKRPPGGETRDPLRPLTANPTRCDAPLEVSVQAENYDGYSGEESTSLGEIEGCDEIDFSPKLSLSPTSRAAAEPTGLDARLTMGQAPETVAEGEEEGEAVATSSPATSHLRYATVTLPEGMTIASGAGDGLAACSAAEVGFETRQPAHCPNAAKIASVAIESPALSAPVHGAVYQRTPVKGDLFGVWLVADELGLHLKLPGQVRADPLTGQLTTSFAGTKASEGLPQAPVSAFELHFFSGPRAPLAAPRKCGTYEATYVLTPWSGRPPQEGTIPISFDRGCDTGGFDPTLSAGSANPLAGAFSPFLTTISLPSGSQNVQGLAMSLPDGVLAKLAGVERCEGAAALSGDCPPASLIGHGIVAAGPGPSPLWLPQPGREPIEVFLAPPYKGAPLSLVVRSPAQAGPFDLGTVVTRVAIQIDPLTARATAISDPLPQILEGVPISYRTIHVALDREGFALNPTGCEQKQALATLTSAEGATASPTAPYRVGGCASLAFKPRLGLKLKGGTRRGAFPALRLVYAPRPGQANTKRLILRFPRSEFIEQGHFRTICTRVQFAAGEGFGSQCPKGSVYGRVKVFTPLLDEPLSGRVLLRSSNHNLPDAVLALEGPPSLPLRFEAANRIDSVKGGLRVRTSELPDVPLTRVVVDMQGGQKGLFVNSTNICAAKHRANVRLDGHNGRISKIKPLVRALGCKKAQRKKNHRRNG